MTLPQPIPLKAIVAGSPGATLEGDPSIVVTDLAYDSRAVRPGSLFFCRKGERTDGHEFAAAAATAGAVALVCERRLPVDVAQVVVPSVARAMGPIAALAFGHPSESLTLAGITGTNGKTTTAFLLERAFAALGLTTGLVGTVETHVAGTVEPAGRTTPESVDLQRLFARMRSSGVDAAAMEVSSHGLALHRVDGIRFACSIFTNLTQDHLDFHGTMDDYFAAKEMLFDRSFTSRAAVNVDDEAGRTLAKRSEDKGLTVTRYAIESTADVRAGGIVMDAGGSTFVCDVRGARFEARVRLAGPFNVANAVAAIAAVDALGMDAEKAAGGIAALPGVPGRFERVDGGQDFTVLVDYAHTPDSVERVLRAARRICAGRLVVVVGCGGDRDRAKRPLMGRAAVELSDFAILTSDNPRSEEPRSIIEQMERGARLAGREYRVEVDRREAIRAAVADAHAGDVVLIAGKGHESGQEFSGRTIPFDDRDVAREELSRR